MHVLFVSGLGGDTRRYRCLHHQEQLALSGFTSVLREAGDPQLYVDAATCDLVILHRTAWTPLLGDVVDIAHWRGKPVVFETDDLVFAPEVFDRIAVLDTMPPDQAQRFRADLARQVETFRHADCVLTTTQYLADAAVARGKPAYIQRNAFSAEMVQAAERAYALRQQHLSAQTAGEDRPVVIGYFSGTGSHNRDFAVVAPVLAELMAHNPRLWLHLSGHIETGGTLLAFSDRIRRAPYVAWQELPNLVAQVDINLAPLELDNPFCQAKSEIKYTEAALVGVPTVASPTEAFAHAMRDGETGLLAASAAAWKAALQVLSEDSAARARLGEAARRAVYATYLPENRGRVLVDTLRTIVTRHAPPAANPAATLAAVTVRMHAQLVRLQDEYAQVQRQADQLRQTLAQWDGQSGGKDASFWRTSLDEAQAREQAALREILAHLARGAARD
jgi:glycosyltransferase involved in cell wall biosynthesis